VEGRPLPLIVPPQLRVGIRRLIEPVLPNVPVVSLGELPAQVNLHSVSTWSQTRAASRTPAVHEERLACGSHQLRWRGLQPGGSYRGLTATRADRAKTSSGTRFEML
jgi:hypothetical protein